MSSYNKQCSPGNIRSESIGKYISIISRHLNYYLNTRAAQHNINNQQLEMLNVLYHQEGISQNTLGAILKLDKITVTKGLKGLIDEGYVIKQTGKEDRRLKNLYITEKGCNIKEDIKKILAESTKILSRNFTQEENTIIRELLYKMSQNIYQAVELKE